MGTVGDASRSDLRQLLQIRINFRLLPQRKHQEREIKSTPSLQSRPQTQQKLEQNQRKTRFHHQRLTTKTVIGVRWSLQDPFQHLQDLNQLGSRRIPPQEQEKVHLDHCHPTQLKIRSFQDQFPERMELTTGKQSQISLEQRNRRKDSHRSLQVKIPRHNYPPHPERVSQR